MAKANNAKEIPVLGTDAEAFRQAFTDHIHHTLARPRPFRKRKRERIPRRLLNSSRGMIAPERLLHRAGRDLERLVEVGAKGHRDRNRDNQRVEPLPPVVLKSLLRHQVR